MKVDEILSEYGRLLTELSEAVTKAEWGRIRSLQDDIEQLQAQFDTYPAVEKEQAHVKDGLRALLVKQETVMQYVAQAKQEAAQHIRRFQLAKTQQQGYLYKDVSIPPVYVDRKK